MHEYVIHGIDDLQALAAFMNVDVSLTDWLTRYRDILVPFNIFSIHVLQLKT